MDSRPRCKWCAHLIKRKQRGRAPDYCSASCRQRAYERRQLEKRAQAKADAINAADYPAWAGQENVPGFIAHLLAKPKLPPRRRPRRLRCLHCKGMYIVKKRGPIPTTCGPRCASMLKTRELIKAVTGRPLKLLDNDMATMVLLDQQKQRFQAIIDGLLQDKKPDAAK